MSRPKTFAEALFSFASSIHMARTHSRYRGHDVRILGDAMEAEQLFGWAKSGFPRFVVDDKLAAALMSTSAKEVKGLKLPWPHLMVQALGFYVIAHAEAASNGAEVCVVTVWDTTSHCDLSDIESAERWTFLRPLDDLVMNEDTGVYDIDDEFYDQHVSRDDLENARRVIHEAGGGSEWESEEQRKRCERVTRLIGRLLVGVIMLSGEAKQSGKRGAGRVGEAQHAETRMETYALTRPVQIDCRPSVRDYISGKARRTAVTQWMVRGHWRNQVCGEGRSERRATWIEPFWKGAMASPSNGGQGGPVRVRPHVFKNHGHEETP